MKIKSARSIRLLRTGIFVTLFAAVPTFSFSQEKKSYRPRTITKDTPNGPNVKFSLGDYERERTFLDSDEDGWCDLWTLIHPNVKHRDKTVDSDGDGLTDYQEMVLWRNPMIKGPMPRKRTAEEIQEARKRATIRKIEAESQMRLKYAERLQLGKETIETANRKKVINRNPTPKQRKERIAELAKSLAKKSEIEAEARIIKRQTLVPQLKQGGVHLQKFLGESPIFISSDNLTAGDTISADDLWPMGSSALPDLTGQGRTIGIWEAAGGVFKDHVELTGRVTQMDDPVAENRSEFDSHATAVAGTIAASGIKAEARGISYQAILEAYTSVDDFSEMANAISVDGMELSNHSYSRTAGWRFITLSQGSFWFWLGPPLQAGEDPVFGLYDFESRNLDLIAYEAKTFLSVHSSGNEANDFGPVNSTAGEIPPGQSYLLPVDLDGDGFLDLSTLTHPSDGGLPESGATIPPQGAAEVGLGFDTIKPSAVAKNNLSVGAIEDVVGGVTLPTQPQIALFSSRGPTDDGRIKPDLTANGVDVVTPNFTSTTETDTYTDDGVNSNGISGTSFSTPSVAGGIGLLQQLNQDKGGDSLLSSTWKALVLNTASDATVIPSYYGVGATNLIGPDYFYGWGVANISRAAEVLDSNLETQSSRVHLREYLMFDGNTIEVPIEHDGTSSEIRVMLCWTDPAFQDSDLATAADAGVPVRETAVVDDATLRLVNDLDLRVITPSGATQMPWVLDPAAPLSAATNGDNFRDNVEQVVISAPEVGIYTIEISRKGTLKAAELVLQGESGYDPNDPTYRLESGREQAISLCISGNKERDSDRLTAVKPIVIGSSVMLEWNNIKGLRYQLERSTDLENWVNIGSPIDTDQSPQPLTVTKGPNEDKAFYRFREIKP